MVEDCECRVQCLRIVGFRVEESGADIGVEAVNEFDVLLGLRVYGTSLIVQGSGCRV